MTANGAVSRCKTESSGCRIDSDMFQIVIIKLFKMRLFPASQSSVSHKRTLRPAVIGAVTNAPEICGACIDAGLRLPAHHTATVDNFLGQQSWTVKTCCGVELENIGLRVRKRA